MGTVSKQALVFTNDLINDFTNDLTNFYGASRFGK